MVEALRVHVAGLVQGVGFRPHVWRLAHTLGLVGWVRNDGAGVAIHVEGERASLTEFCRRLAEEAPPSAIVDSLASERAQVLGLGDFLILDSTQGRVSTRIGPDSAPCQACLAELFDRRDRRYRYPFITCTHCGPRYTVTRALPYDRPQTSLASFPLCRECEREYRDPYDRRFHAETTCCPACGPTLTLLDAHGAPIVGDPLEEVWRLLQAGRIVAIKGIGGFHLCCDALQSQAVAMLRARKQREEKPFALMALNTASAAHWVELDAHAIALLESPERPIVLLPKRKIAEQMPVGIAPGLAELGIMLPSSPLSYLLFHAAAGKPDGLAWLEKPLARLFVMTSANPHGEPLVIDNDEALKRLQGIADAYLVHDREILVRCDDSVRRTTGFVRRARGYVPQPIRLPRPGPPVLALGGFFKNTICMTRGDEAFVSQHVGDLDNPRACVFFEETVAHLMAILAVKPEIIAHDLHPDFHATRYALELGVQHGVPTLAVQHHHAHIAAVCAEWGLVGPVLGLALDGVGLGADGRAWGGELLRVEGAFYERLGYLRELPLPGGDAAAKEPWRMAAAVLACLDRAHEIFERFGEEPAATTVATMLAKRFNCPPTSSAGRLFDAAAALLGVRRRNTFEGQAAMALEGLAARQGRVPALPDGWRIDAENRLDLLPLMDFLCDCEDAAAGAALFHATFAAALVDWVAQTAQRVGITHIVAAGGCLLNQVLRTLLGEGLHARGLAFFLPEKLPPNDGGLSLGQAWVALSARFPETS
ncbi:MAG: carbamoyltransferase HypF [Rhodocyclaceae bacterium]|nr:carbamoyltransferase HypF [Rhodocyclaceae bacterium]